MNKSKWSVQFASLTAITLISCIAAQARAQSLTLLAATETSDPNIGFRQLGIDDPIINSMSDVAFSGVREFGPLDRFAVYVWNEGMLNQVSNPLSNVLYRNCPGDEYLLSLNQSFVSFFTASRQVGSRSFFINTGNSIGGSSVYLSFDSSGNPANFVATGNNDPRGLVGVSDTNEWLMFANRQLYRNINGCASSEVIAAAFENGPGIQPNSWISHSFQDGLNHTVGLSSVEAISSNGDIVFAANIGDQFQEPNSSSIVFRSAAGEWSFVAKAGDQASGWPAGVVYSPLYPSARLSISNSSFAFERYVSDETTGGLVGIGLWHVSTLSMTPQLVAYQPFGSVSPSITLPLASAPSAPRVHMARWGPAWSINSMGQLAFVAFFSEAAPSPYQNYQSGVYVYSASGYRLITLIGQDDNGQGFDGAEPLFINNNGMVAFRTVRFETRVGSLWIESAVDGLLPAFSVGDLVTVPNPTSANGFDTRSITSFGLGLVNNAGVAVSTNANGYRVFTDDGRMAVRLGLLDELGPSEAFALVGPDPCRASPVDPSTVLCTGDYNGDGVTDDGDIFALMNLIASGGSPCFSVDFNNDGVRDQGDVDALVNFNAGGSPAPGCM